MAESKYIVDGVIYQEDDERKVIAGGRIVEETTAAAPAGAQLQTSFKNTNQFKHMIMR